MHLITSFGANLKFKYQKLDPFIIQWVRNHLKRCKLYYGINFKGYHTPKIERKKNTKYKMKSNAVRCHNFLCFRLAAPSKNYAEKFFGPFFVIFAPIEL